MIRQVQPVLPSRDVSAAIQFYVERLGFSLALHVPQQPAYAAVRRDGVELHLQWHDPNEWARIERPMLRFLVSDVDALHREFLAKAAFHPQTELRSTPWGTREFAFFDPDKNGLTFYIDV